MIQSVIEATSAFLPMHENRLDGDKQSTEKLPMPTPSSPLRSPLLLPSRRATCRWTALRQWTVIALIGFAGFLPSAATAVVAPTSIELEMMATWVRENFLSNRVPPFSFKYGGTPSTSLLSSWPRQVTTVDVYSLARHVIVWTDVQSGLEVRCEMVEYRDYPVAEWTVYIKNVGTQNSGILRDILGLDMSLSRTARFE